MMPVKPFGSIEGGKSNKEQILKKKCLKAGFKTKNKR